MGKTSLVFYFLFFNTILSYGQQQTYFVQFTDKNTSLFSIDQPEDYLSNRAIVRRSKCKVSIDQKDFPVTQTYIDQVVLLGAQLLYPLKWFNGIVVRSDINVKNQIALLSYVTAVDASVVFRKGVKKSTQSFLNKSAILEDFGNAFLQNDMLGISQMHNEGYTGNGVLIAITDDGFLNTNINAGFNTLYTNGQVIGTHDLVDIDTSLYQQGGGHGAEVFSIIAGSLSGQFSSPAIDADYMLFRTEDVSSESPLEELNWVRAAELADSSGVDIIQVSLGYTTFDDPALDHSWLDLDGASSYISKGASIAYQKGIIVVVSAGNEGDKAWKKILCPADVDGVLAIGAVDYTETRSGFSSYGNSADGRIKPDLMALGQGVSFIGTDGLVRAGSGTSFASPLISGLAAGLVQAHPTLTHKQIMYAMRLSADRYLNPDSYYGYGIPNYTKASQYATIMEDEASVFVFPNPFATSLSMKVQETAIGSMLDWDLYSINGQRIAKGKQVIAESLVTLWSTEFIPAAGMYMLHVSIDGMRRTYKVIK